MSFIVVTAMNEHSISYKCDNKIIKDNVLILLNCTIIVVLSLFCEINFKKKRRFTFNSHVLKDRQIIYKNV